MSVKYPYMLFCDDCLRRVAARVTESVCPYCGGSLRRGPFSRNADNKEENSNSPAEAAPPTTKVCKPCPGGWREE